MVVKEAPGCRPLEVIYQEANSLMLPIAAYHSIESIHSFAQCLLGVSYADRIHD